MVPTVGQLKRYRGAKVYFATPDTNLAAGERIDAEHNSVRRGSLQHEIIEGAARWYSATVTRSPSTSSAWTTPNGSVPGRTVRYALVVSVETAVETSTTIHDEIRERLREQARGRTRGRVQS